MKTIDEIQKSDILPIVKMEHHNPFSILGPHEATSESGNNLSIRVYLPGASSVAVVDEMDMNIEYPMMENVIQGFYTTSILGKTGDFRYRLKVKYENGSEALIYDPYAFPQIITEYDLYLFNEGSNTRIFEKLGAHIKEINGVKGVHFAVWAPNARGVSVKGDFNGWDGRLHQMRVLGSSGVWEIFIPEIGEMEKYKFSIKTLKGEFLEKSDPYAFFTEKRPKSASVVYDVDRFTWSDHGWMESRQKREWNHEPVSIYEVHLGSWMKRSEDGNRFLTYRELADELVGYVTRMGFTHIELLPPSEHPLDDSWGYQVTGYFSATSRFGTPDGFMYFIDRCHENGVGVIMDWVPGHFPRDGHGLIRFDGTALYEHEDPRIGEHKEWGTLIFNYGRNEVKNFLISNLLFWMEKFHIDGVRVDAVASMLYLDYGRENGEWIPNKYGGNENLEAVQFLKEMNSLAYNLYPGIITIAEESTAWPGVSTPVYLGGLGFGFKWNMGWMHDILEYFTKDPIFRRYHHNNLTFALLYAFHENFILSISHDEVVHGKRALLDKMPGDYWQKFANLRALLGYMFGQPGKKLLFMGAEIGQWREWDFRSGLEWHLLQYEDHRKLQNFMRDLNHLYRREPSLWEVDFDHSGFEWIDFHDVDNNIVSFIRRAKTPSDYLVLVYNFSPTPRVRYRVGVPEHRMYAEIFNSDSEFYGGTNMGNGGGKWSEAVPWNNMDYSLSITLPPLSALIFKPA